MDKVAHGTHARGERSPNAKLTKEQVKEIRLLTLPRLTDAALAKRYGVARETISQIRRGEKWSWLV